ncbi:hypothetical protein R5R35_009908 [Gryllus longicercus]|uniref:ODAD1 central coiled coil region domain-containing protein n=1 Tax=Gryllus longicercus TaxID=2509291 RepID=A0AAN9ZD29_9ORTH|nr:Uncharacterized protein GBIM_09695 [Gryllus bimaculatus]
MAKKLVLPVPDETELAEMAEAELSRLQRQYRIMETERQTYSITSSAVIKKQRDMIEKLEKEKHEILMNLAIATSTGNELRDIKQEKAISHDLSVHSHIDAAIKREKGQLNELDVQIFRLEKEVVKMRLKDVSDLQSKERAIDDERSISNLENRLHVASVKYNDMIKQNTILREEIDHLLKERSHFNELYQKLIKHINKGKKVMMDLIEQASLAYDQREEAQIKLQCLREKGRQDYLQQSHEMRELQRKLDHDTKLQEFLSVKGQKRVMADLEAREAQKKRQQREAAERMISKYKSILYQIREFMGEEDIDRIAAKFVKQEEENFALFNYVNELNNELQVLQDQVEDLRTRIDEQRVLNQEREQQQQQRLETMQEELEKLRHEADNAQEQRLVSSRSLETLLCGIEQVFKKIRCDNSPLLQLLGENTHVMPYNVMLYLNIIERRTHEFLSTIFYLESQRAQQGRTFLLVDQPMADTPPVPLQLMAPTQPCVLCVEQEEFQEMNESAVSPVTLPEAKQRVADKLTIPDYLSCLHNISQCRLPRSRKIMQKRYL